MADTFLTVAEIAELLKLNPQTVRNWIDRGELQAVRVGARRVRVRQSDLDRFLEAGSTQRNEAQRLSARDQLIAAVRTASTALDDDAEARPALDALAEAADRVAQALIGEDQKGPGP